MRLVLTSIFQSSGKNQFFPGKQNMLNNSFYVYIHGRHNKSKYFVRTLYKIVNVIQIFKYDESPWPYALQSSTNSVGCITDANQHAHKFKIFWCLFVVIGAWYTVNYIESMVTMMCCAFTYYVNRIQLNCLHES